MNHTIWTFAVMTFLLVGCGDAMKVGNDTARELTGAHMVQQGKQAEQKLHEIERQQQQRMEQLNQQ